MSESDSIENYQILQSIGKGNFGDVKLCIRKSDKLILVIKIIDTKTMTINQKEDLNKEVLLLAELKHPNIVEYIGSFYDTGYFYILMENCAGGDLDKKINALIDKKEQLSEADAIKWFYQLASALQKCHACKILHRDLKPSNVMLSENGDIKLGDFGVSRSLDKTGNLANTVIGTPYSMSPELCNSDPYSYPSDMWGLGCIFFELLAQRRPFLGNSLLDLVWNIVRSEPPELPELYCEDLKKVIYKLLSKIPDERPTVDQLINILLPLRNPVNVNSSPFDSAVKIAVSRLKDVRLESFSPLLNPNGGNSSIASPNKISPKPTLILDDPLLSPIQSPSLPSTPKTGMSTPLHDYSLADLTTPRGVLLNDNPQIKRGSIMVSNKSLISPGSVPNMRSHRNSGNFAGVIKLSNNATPHNVPLRMTAPPKSDIVGSSSGTPVSISSSTNINSVMVQISHAPRGSISNLTNFITSPNERQTGVAQSPLDRGSMALPTNERTPNLHRPFSNRKDRRRSTCDQSQFILGNVNTNRSFNFSSQQNSPKSPTAPLFDSESPSASTFFRRGSLSADPSVENAYSINISSPLPTYSNSNPPSLLPFDFRNNNKSSLSKKVSASSGGDLTPGNILSPPSSPPSASPPTSSRRKTMSIEDIDPPYDISKSSAVPRSVSMVPRGSIGGSRLLTVTPAIDFSHSLLSRAASSVPTTPTVNRALGNINTPTSRIHNRTPSAHSTSFSLKKSSYLDIDDEAFLEEEKKHQELMRYALPQQRK